MPITTPLTELLGIRHPILLAPMDTIAGSRLTRAVSEAGGLGILGGPRVISRLLPSLPAKRSA